MCVELRTCPPRYILLHIEAKTIVVTPQKRHGTVRIAGPCHHPWNRRWCQDGRSPPSKLDGYSAASRWVHSTHCMDSPMFRASGHFSWKLFYFPNGTRRIKSGLASVKLTLMDGAMQIVLAAYRLSILDGAGNPAYSYCMAPHKYI